MSSLIICNHETGRVEYQHRKPDTLTSSQVEELISIGAFYAGDIPEPIDQEGKSPVLFFNLKTKELYYEYEDILQVQEDTQVERIAALEAQNNELMIALAGLSAANEQDKIETQLAIAELATLITGGNA